MSNSSPGIPQHEQREIDTALGRMGLLRSGPSPPTTRLSGGVSCDVYRVNLPTQTICLKRALPELRVKAGWRAPAERAQCEVAWMRLVHEFAPANVPAILGEDPEGHMFAMAYFPPNDYPVWKTELASGHIEPVFSATVGRTIAKIHAATAARGDIRKRFDNAAQFHALRIDPFLLYVANRPEHRNVAHDIRWIAQQILNARIALMHGDVSPKNILHGPGGPIFLDAETASYGDPAFDLAFCLNHLLLKCVWHPEWASAYLECFSAMKRAYLDGVSWENPQDLESRAARILPAVALARVDGKSPAEYLADEGKRDFVRKLSKAMLRRPPKSLASLSVSWANALREILP